MTNQGRQSRGSGTASWEPIVERLEAIGRDGRWDQAAQTEVAKGLSHHHELARIEAVETAEALGAIGFLPRLRRLLSDTSPLVRAAAATAIGSIGTARDKHRLAKRFAAERSPRARVGLAAGLWLLGESPRFDALMNLLGSKQYRVRCAVANTLAFHRDRVRDRDRPLVVLRRALTAEDTVAAREAIQRAIGALDQSRRSRATHR